MEPITPVSSICLHVTIARTKMSIVYFFTCFAVVITAVRAVEERCCLDAGCFNDSAPYDGLSLPKCPEELMMSMKVYTRLNPTTGQSINRSYIPPSFDGLRTTVFIVHGYLQSETAQWMSDVKDALLKRGDFNVIIVGWKGGSQLLLNYPQATSNTRSAGTEIALVAAKVIANGNSDKSRLYCVGHSLGAHVCGHAGMKTKFGRITGLDPAGPLFEDRPLTAGLNPDCADLVDVIHTDGRTYYMSHFGTMNRLGHVDFYPNGGESQPGCFPNFFSIYSLLNIEVACSHMRAIYLFTESIKSPCFSTSQDCSYEQDLPGSCTLHSNSSMQSMGLDAAAFSARGIFYLETSRSSPYCSGVGNRR